MENRIRELLETGGADLSGIPAGFAPAPEYDIRAASGSSSERITRELYGGYQRNTGLGGWYVAQNEYYKEVNQTLVYQDRVNTKISLYIYMVPGLTELSHCATLGRPLDMTITSPSDSLLPALMP